MWLAQGHTACEKCSLIQTQDSLAALSFPWCLEGNLVCPPLTPKAWTLLKLTLYPPSPPTVLHRQL